MKRVLFVCLGNICRSPTAHGVFEQLATERGVSVRVDSCGTGGWHAGEPPDARATAAAATRGYDLSPLRARQLASQDFDHFDYILAMDEQNLRDVEALRPADYAGHVGLFLDYTGQSGAEVPDPYYGGAAGFDRVLDLIEAASEGLLAELRDAADSSR